MAPKSSEAASPSTTTTATYYLVPNLRAVDSGAREVDLDAHSWVRPIVIEDEDLMFGGKSLSAWYEEERQRQSSGGSVAGGNSSDEEQHEERRGRERVRRHYSPSKAHRK